jgi:hypothetical protein
MKCLIHAGPRLGVGAQEVSTFEIGASQIGVPEIRIPKLGPPEIDVSHDRASQNCACQVG